MNSRPVRHCIADLKLHRVAKSAGVGQALFIGTSRPASTGWRGLYRHELTQLVDVMAPLLAEHPPLRALNCWLQRPVEYARVACRPPTRLLRRDGTLPA
jgi:hypothetical protein